MTGMSTRYYDDEVVGSCTLEDGRKVKVIDHGFYDYTCNAYESSEGYPILEWVETDEEFTHEEYEIYLDWVLENAEW